MNADIVRLPTDDPDLRVLVRAAPPGVAEVPPDAEVMGATDGGALVGAMILLRPRPALPEAVLNGLAAASPDAVARFSEPRIPARLFVDPKHRCRGLGRSLVAALSDAMTGKVEIPVAAYDRGSANAALRLGFVADPRPAAAEVAMARPLFEPLEPVSKPGRLIEVSTASRWLSEGKGRVDDLLALAAIGRAESHVERALDWTLADVDLDRTWVAGDDGSLVAASFVKRAHTSMTVVAPSHRRLGLARELKLRSLSQLAEHGHSWATTHVAPDRVIHRLNQSLGYLDVTLSTFVRTFGGD